MRFLLPHPERSPWPAIAVFLASVLTVLLFWTVLPGSFKSNESTDYEDYYAPVARRILEGRGIVTSFGTPAILWPPGYPLILAGIFGLSDLLKLPEGTVLSAFILLCIGLASLLLFSLAKTVWGPLAAMSSSLLFVTYPLVLWLTKQPNSEIPFMVVFYGGFRLFWHALSRKSERWPIYFVTGLLVGLAMLIRPIAIGLGFAMAAILWLIGREMTMRSRVFLIVMMLLGNLVVIFPWEAWVYSRTQRVVLLSTVASSVIDGLTFPSQPDHVPTVKGKEDVHEMRDVRTGSEGARSLTDLVSMLAGELRARPATVAKRFAIKATRSWYVTDSRRFETLILLIQIAYAVLILWSVRFAWGQRGIGKRLAISICLVVLYFWGMTLLTWSIVRYMVPVVGLSFVLFPSLLAGRDTRLQFQDQSGQP